MSDRGIFIDVCVPTAVKLKFSLTLFGLELIENVQLYPYYLLCSDGADLKKSAPSVSVIGLGYVGLCTAVTLASRGFRVIGVDNDETKLELIQGAKSPFHEPRLNNLVRKGIQKQTLEVTKDVSRVSSTGLTFLTVGTPSLEDGSIDLTFVKEATHGLGNAIRTKQAYHVVVVKSTVVPGTTNNVVKPILEQSSGKVIGKDLGLCANPEFLREGTAVYDTLHPDVVVIGANDARSARTVKAFISRFHGK